MTSLSPRRQPSWRSELVHAWLQQSERDNNDSEDSVQSCLFGLCIFTVNHIKLHFYSHSQLFLSFCLTSQFRRVQKLQKTTTINDNISHVFLYLAWNMTFWATSKWPLNYDGRSQILQVFVWYISAHEPRWGRGGEIDEIDFCTTMLYM